MLPTDFTETGFFTQERQRAAEQRRRYNLAAESEQANQRAHGQVSLLTQIAQRLHVKAQPQTSSDDRRAHAV